MDITRRTAVKLLSAAAVTLPPRRATAQPAPTGGKAILYDQTRCVGCRECVLACAEANGWDAAQAFTPDPGLCEEAPTVLRRYTSGSGEDCFLKLQCMHCVSAPCVSACMLGAMSKDADGAVVWNPELCVGCRYCEIACPFTVPRFEWDTPVPKLTKCELCPARRAAGLLPACVSVCRRGALSYGTREEMLAEARRRRAEHPERYNPKVYGEHDGGGTSVLYMARAGVPFTALGLPELGDESVAELPESLQHTLYRGFAAPLALFALLGALVRRSTRGLSEQEEARRLPGTCRPVGGEIFTPSFAVLVGLTLVGVLTILWRYTVGLGATTNLNDGYPMGLWIAFDVVTGTALACGGYAVALLVFVANRGHYHPLVRPALLTSAFGYTLAGLSVLVDIGRPWNFYRIPLFFWDWNLNSVLLEVALCIMLYTMVLWVEVSPAILEGWRESELTRLRKLSALIAPRLERALPYLIAFGLLLPTMHQSSLGSLMLIAGSKLHPFWHTPLLPLLFLISCVSMGYAAVVLESVLSARAFRRPVETPMLRGLAVPIAVTLVVYVAVRMADLALKGRLGMLPGSDGYGVLLACELVLFLAPAVLLVTRRSELSVTTLAGAAVLVIGGGALYRFSTYLFAFDPGAGWSYFPALPEFAVTVGFVSAEILGYVVMVKRFPILRGDYPEVRAEPVAIADVPRSSPLTEETPIAAAVAAREGVAAPADEATQWVPEGTPPAPAVTPPETEEVIHVLAPLCSD